MIPQHVNKSLNTFFSFINLFTHIFLIIKLVIYAWNPGSNGLSYHGGNRGSMKINFFSSVIAQSAETKNRFTRLLHGVAMFLTWRIVFDLNFNFSFYLIIIYSFTFIFYI